METHRCIKNGCRRVAKLRLTRIFYSFGGHGTMAASPAAAARNRQPGVCNDQSHCTCRLHHKKKKKRHPKIDPIQINVIKQGSKIFRWGQSQSYLLLFYYSSLYMSLLGLYTSLFSSLVLVTAKPAVVDRQLPASVCLACSAPNGPTKLVLLLYYE